MKDKYFHCHFQLQLDLLVEYLRVAHTQTNTKDKTNNIKSLIIVVFWKLVLESVPAIEQKYLIFHSSFDNRAPFVGGIALNIVDDLIIVHHQVFSQ